MTERRARRVYGALVWLAGRGGASRQRLVRLREWAGRLGLDDDAAREVEAAARAGRSLRIGRDPAERELLRRAARELAGDDLRLVHVAEALLRRAPPRRGGVSTRGGRPCPFEESEVGPPLVWRPAAPR